MTTHSIPLADPELHPVTEPSPRRGDRRRQVLVASAAGVLVAALLVLGPNGLIPVGLLLALSTDPDEENHRRSVLLTTHNLGVAAAMTVAFAWFWLRQPDLTETMQGTYRGGALIATTARPPGHRRKRRHPRRTVALTKR